MSPPHPSPADAQSQPEHQAYLSVQRLAADLAHQTAELLKGSALSPAQYNVLRILRGAGEDGLTCGDIGARLITRDSDVTRLLDRLEKQGLVTRVRSARDRRVILSAITPEGRRLLAALDAPLAALHRAQFGHLGPQRLAALQDLLREVALGLTEKGQPPLEQEAG